MYNFFLSILHAHTMFILYTILIVIFNLYKRLKFIRPLHLLWKHWVEKYITRDGDKNDGKTKFNCFYYYYYFYFVEYIFVIPTSIL